MSQFLNFQEVEPAAYKAMSGLEMYIRNSGLPPKLLHLIKFRASQINGCAFCLDMHSREARHDGDTEQRLYTISAWRETPFFTDAERAVVAYTEQVTKISEAGVSEEARQELARHFSPEEIVRITMVIITINGWNRFAISSGMSPVEQA